MVYDTSHVFHVSKSGNDSNSGLAQQYPIDLAADSKLTINGALSAASDGDTIIIHPGSYNEAVDLSAASKSIHLIGTNRNSCEITTASTNISVKLTHDCVIENLKITHTGTGSAISHLDSYNIQIIGCHVESTHYGCYFAGGLRNLKIINSFMKADYACVFIGGSTLIDNCILITTGLSSGVTHSVAFELTGSESLVENNIIVRNSLLLALPAYGKATGKSPELYQTIADLYAFHSVAEGYASIIFDNCSLMADGKPPYQAHASSYAQGDSFALNNGPYADSTFDPKITMNNCILFARTDPNYSKTAYAIQNANVKFINCHIETDGVAASYDFYSYSVARTAKLFNVEYDKTKVNANYTVQAVNGSALDEILSEHKSVGSAGRKLLEI